MHTLLTISDLDAAIARKHAEGNGTPFSKRETPEGYLYSYHFNGPGCFDGPDADLLRECRGLIMGFDGKVVSRPYHKFFNVGEKDETQLSVLPNEPHYILEKLDGSMIRPVKRDGQIRFATKNGVTDVAAQVDVWAQTHPEVLSLCEFIMSEGGTPIFEWCSNKMRIVIDHPVDRLVLTAIRDNETGDYMPYPALEVTALYFGVEVVKAHKVDTSDWSAFTKHVRALEGMEGFVVRYEHGFMVKFKADDYLKVHRTLDILRSEKNLLAQLALGSLDDIIGRLRQSDRDAVLAFQKRAQEGIAGFVAQALKLTHDTIATVGTNRRDFALKVKDTKYGWLCFILFQTGDKDPQVVATDAVLARIARKGGDVEDCRELIGGVCWADYRAGLAPTPDEE